MQGQSTMSAYNNAPLSCILVEKTNNKINKQNEYSLNRLIYKIDLDLNNF